MEAVTFSMLLQEVGGAWDGLVPLATLQAWLGQMDGVPSPNLARSHPYPSACPWERDPHLAQTTVGPEHSLKLGLAVA